MKARESTAEQDRALLASTATGDEAAFVQLYQRFSAPLFSLLYKMLQNTEDAEEVLQVAFTQVWKKAATYDPARCSAFTWLVLIGRSKAIDHMRQRQRHTRTVDTVASEEAVTGVNWTSDANVAQNEQRTAVMAALQEIAPDQREAIEMAFFRGMTQTEISDSLQEPLGTIKARIRRGMLRLRDHLIRRQ